MTFSDRSIAALLRTVAKAAAEEAVSRTRTPKLLSGTVEDLSSDLDIGWIRMDQESTGSDPTQSDNYEAPGVIPATRLGETFTAEQVRVEFDGSAGATAMRTSAENIIVLPYGKEDGQRIILDGNTGTVQFYNEAGQLVGLLSTQRWYAGTDGGALTQIDPVGGLRIRSGNDELTVDLNSQPALTMRDPNTGITRVVLRGDGLHIIEPETGISLEMTTGGFGVPDPRFNSTTEASPGTSMDTPAASTFTGDDIEIRSVVAWHGSSSIASPSFTPPTNYTERTDSFDNSNGRTLHATVATRQPAVSDAVRTFTNSSSAFESAVGSTIVVRGGGSSSPSFRATSEAFTEVGNNSEAVASLDKPTGTVEGDVLIAVVSMGNFGGSVPIGWTTPEGWIFLGANFVFDGGGSTQSTLAAGVWYKRASASEPADYTITINFGDVGYKRLHAVMVAVADPGTFSTGAGFRFDGRLMPRLIEAVELESSASSYTFENIPPDFDHLELVLALISVGSGADSTNVSLRFNGDSGSNYAWRTSGTLGDNDNQNGSALVVGTLWTGDPDFRSTLEVSIPDYSRPTQRPTVIGQFTMRSGGGTPNTLLGFSGGRWTGTDAITSVEVRTAGATQMKTGSKLWLYGK